MTANPQPALEWDNWQDVRGAIALLAEQGLEMLGPPETSIHELVIDIPARDGHKNSTNIYRPTSLPPSGSPLIVMFFGGGWISGSKDANTAFAHAYVRAFGATVVSPSYRMSPEHKFPVPPQDAWDTVKWLDEHAAELGADLKQGFIVSGVSAGATNSAVAATHAIENELTHPITGQYLCVPSTMDEESVPEKFKPYFKAYEQNKNAPILPTSALAALQGHTSWDAESPWRHVIRSKAPLSKQSPAYFQVDGMDPLRDEGLIWEEMLKEAGVKTKLDFYPGCPHGHHIFMPGIEVSNKATADQLIGVGWLLGKDITAEQGLSAMMPNSA
ncbi:AB hydrolase superfamily protein [Fulvia fulva]|uniref:AB hydrolase superfamily protein n=1 Tax=Passalora fulva TaxID=5499 RepID=A0A9Q8L612_PASFU|nr:AB hydrolase superfamily protein [Fulvia fulva]KAK4634279.1 AB hydrolase superfamily protein [Fulvia fulva]KAK4637072.1 AB hydrolase superfamily protein [Fulvia fulva]UJO11526.1 AB hydrolase superfamily protein [Fulvia fulva]WPV09631.1 AB hydrolase superfamily protein [Fulvia fulva]WPV25220.1 AB hydrolase superfamily protein [Fulvia fulva]